MNEKANHSARGMGADSLKLAVDLFRERLLDDLDAKSVIACHHELGVECPKERAKEVARFLQEPWPLG